MGTYISRWVAHRPPVSRPWHHSIFPLYLLTSMVLAALILASSGAAAMVRTAEGYADPSIVATVPAQPVRSEPEGNPPAVPTPFRTPQLDFVHLQSDLVGTMNEYGPRSALWYEDLRTGRRLVIGADEAFDPASTVKLPLTIALFEGAEEGRWSLDDLWTISDADWEDGAGSLQATPAGTAFTLRDLARRAIVESDNIAVNALARRVGFAAVRASMRQAGADLSSDTLTSLTVGDMGAVLEQLARRQSRDPAT